MNEPRNSPAHEFSLRHLVKGATLYGFADVITLLARFLLLALYTRILDEPAEFGYLAVVTTTIMLATTLLPAGLPSAMMIRIRVDNPAESRKLQHITFQSLLLVCTAVAAGSWLIVSVWFPRSMTARFLPWLILWGTAAIIAFVPIASLRIRERLLPYNIARIVHVGVLAAVVIGAYRAGSANLATIIKAEALGITAELVLCALFDRYVPSFRTFTGLRHLLRLGLPLCAVSMGFFLIDLSDRYILAGFLGTEAAGYYATAARLAVAGAILAEAINAMWTPYYFRMAAQGAVATDRFGRIATRIIVLFALVVSVLIFLLPVVMTARFPFTGVFFVARQYHAAAVLLPPLLLPFLFKLFFYVALPPLEFAEKTGLLLLLLVPGVLVNIGGNLLAVSLPVESLSTLHRMIAVALMTGIAYLLCGILAFMSLHRSFSGLLLRPLPLLLGTAAAVVPLIPIPSLTRLVLWLLCCGAIAWMFRDSVAALVSIKRDRTGADGMD